MNIFNKIYSLISEEVWMRTFGRAKLRKIKDLLIKNKYSTLLEVGCAEGYITRKLILDNIILKAKGVDIRNNKLKKAKLRSKKEGIQNKVSFEYGNAIKLPFKKNSFDVVIVPDVLEHLSTKDDVIKAIKEAYRVSKKLVIITVPQIRKVWDYWILLELDHLRVLLKHNNFWIYNRSNFNSLLNKLKVNYKEEGKYSISFYVIKKK